MNTRLAPSLMGVLSVLLFACTSNTPGGSFAVGPTAGVPYDILAVTSPFVTASANAGLASAPNAIDGDPRTCWGSGTASNPALTLGLGSVLALRGLSLKVNPNAGPYAISISTDGRAWRRVRTGVSNSSWNLESKSLPAGTRAAFVRLEFRLGGPNVMVFSAAALPDITVPPSPTSAVTPTPAPHASGVPSPIPVASASPFTASAAPAIIGGRGFHLGMPWLSCYGTAPQMGDLSKVASTFRVINVDCDPGTGNLTAAQIATLKAGGRNRVISYLNLGSVETWRDYWTTAPAGLVPAAQNTAAQLGAYSGYADETWMDLGNADYQKLILEYVAARLVAQGADGFYLDNLELVEHSATSTNGPCSAATRQGGLDLVWKLRQKYPNLLFVMQNATSDVTRLGTTHGVPYASLLDGIAHEEVYKPTYDATAESELKAWRGMGLTPGGRPFWIGTEDYVGSATNVTGAQAAYTASSTQGFSPYAADASGQQRVPFYWGF